RGRADAEADLADDGRLTRLGGVEWVERVDAQRADEAEVHVEPPVGRELHEEVLPPRLGYEQLLAVELRRAGCESSLRAADPRGRARERVLELPCDAMDRVAFGHALMVPEAALHGGGRWAGSRRAWTAAGRLVPRVITRIAHRVRSAADPLRLGVTTRIVYRGRWAADPLRPGVTT